MTTEQSDWLDDNTDPEERRRELQGAIDRANAKRDGSGSNVDALRELSKVEAALEAAEAHLTKQNEANAALHMSERVLYSPLTVAVVNARESAKKIRAALDGGDR